MDVETAGRSAPEQTGASPRRWFVAWMLLSAGLISKSTVSEIKGVKNLFWRGKPWVSQAVKAPEKVPDTSGS